VPRRARCFLVETASPSTSTSCATVCDMEALVTYEGTAEVQSLIVGRHITGAERFRLTDVSGPTWRYACHRDQLMGCCKFTRKTWRRKKLPAFGRCDK